MLYFDTSFLVPLLLPEATSVGVADFIRELPANQFTISHWTKVEFSSLIAREARMGGLEAQMTALVEARFNGMVDESFNVLLPNIDDYMLAREYLGNYGTGLRAGDAFDLAIARNHRAERIYSLDKRLLKAGRSLGLPVDAGLRLAGYEGRRKT